MKSYKTVIPYAIFACTFLGTSAAMAAAFQLKEQSASKLGNAFAGYTAHADDISIIWQNPAAMTMFNGTQSLMSMSAIIPHTELESSSASSTFGFTGTGSETTQGDIGQDAILPAMYFMYDPGDADYRLGLSINTPFGLTTKYDATAISRYSGLTSEIKTITITPSVAYQINDNWSIGGGPQVQYFDIRLTRALNCGEIANSQSAGVFGTNGGALAEDCFLDHTGDDVAAGFVAGVHANYDRFKFGLTYRSKVAHDLEGEVDVHQSALISGTPALAGISAQLPDQTITSRVITPETVSIGAAYQASPKVTLLADAVWTNWTRLEDLTINYNTGLLGQASSSDALDYDDAWFISAGVDYAHNDNLTLRGGVAYDWSPIPEETRSTILPDQDRLWLTAGVGYKINDKFSLDLSYAHLMAESATVNEEGSAASGTPTFTGEYDSSVDIVGLQLNYKF